jgi:hypothetical protein
MTEGRADAGLGYRDGEHEPEPQRCRSCGRHRGIVPERSNANANTEALKAADDGSSTAATGSEHDRIARVGSCGSVNDTQRLALE